MIKRHAPAVFEVNGQMGVACPRRSSLHRVGQRLSSDNYMVCSPVCSLLQCMVQVISGFKNGREMLSWLLMVYFIVAGWFVFALK